MSKKEKYKRYGWEDAYDTEIENNWTNRLNLDDCIEIMNNQYNKIEELKHQLAEKDKEIKRLEQQIENNQRDYVSELAYYTAEENIKEIRHQVCDEIKEKLCRIEDTLINLGNGKEDALNYFVKILDQVEGDVK